MSVDVRDLSWFEVMASDDVIKSDLELICLHCASIICDVEPGDTLAVLVEMTLAHVCDAS